MTLREEIQEIWGRYDGRLCLNDSERARQFDRELILAAKGDYSYALLSPDEIRKQNINPGYAQSCVATKVLLEQRLVEALTCDVFYVQHFAMLIAENKHDT